MCRRKAFICGICATNVSWGSFKVCRRALSPFIRALEESMRALLPAVAKTILFTSGTSDAKSLWRRSPDTHERWIAWAGIQSIHRCWRLAPTMVRCEYGGRSQQLAIAHWADHHHHQPAQHQLRLLRHPSTITTWTMSTWEIQIMKWQAGTFRRVKRQTQISPIHQVLDSWVNYFFFIRNFAILWIKTAK